MKYEKCFFSAIFHIDIPSVLFQIIFSRVFVFLKFYTFGGWIDPADLIANDG